VELLVFNAQKCKVSRDPGYDPCSNFFMAHVGTFCPSQGQVMKYATECKSFASHLITVINHNENFAAIHTGL